MALGGLVPRFFTGCGNSAQSPEVPPSSAPPSAPGASPAFPPFTADLRIPPTAQPSTPFVPECSVPQGLGLGAPTYYTIRLRKAMTEIIPGLRTEIWGYDGLYPGPTLRARHNEPVIVRFVNELPVETLVHNHGAHVPAESDGSPVDGLTIPPGRHKDVCYPNVAPLDPTSGTQALSDFPSTLWYHDHRMGATGRQVSMGLAGFYLLSDALEERLIADGVLPASEFDIPLVIQDRRIGSDGSLRYEPDTFDGVLGDVFVVNGVAQPRFRVRRRKYRLRILNGSSARWYELRLSQGGLLQIGADSWLLPNAMTPSASGRAHHIQLAPAERADVIVDFRQAPEEVFLENILQQTDGRGPGGLASIAVPLMQFLVDQGDTPVDNATIAEGHPLRPHTGIRSDEVVQTRTFVFDHDAQGRWVINDQPFGQARVDAEPQLGTAERWILVNGGSGWSHPVHIHLEAHQIQRMTGRTLDPHELFKKDTVRLGPRQSAEVLLRFRTFRGKFVFHCHNLEHEDHDMMGVFRVV